MPKPKTVAKALMQEIAWDKHGKVKSEGRRFKVQFNPESLKLTFANQIKGGDKSGGSAIQFSGPGSTKLSFELWFDVSAPNAEDSFKGITDVRRITKQVSEFMKPKQKGKAKKAKFFPPGVRFLWGSFLFEGVMESFNETLEFFSEKGEPLRASVSVSMTKQDVEVKFGPKGDAKGEGNGKNDGKPGQDPVTTPKEGETLPQTAARNNVNPEKSQAIALANKLESLHSLPTGVSLNVNLTENIDASIN